MRKSADIIIPAKQETGAFLFPLASLVLRFAQDFLQSTTALKMSWKDCWRRITKIGQEV